MNKIKIKSLHGKNFMSYQDREISVGDRTVIKGKNRSGKTTSKHLLNWVLLNKNAYGKSPDGIRPHDENGKDTDHVEIAGTVVLDINGREVKIQKVQKQIWRTDRKTKEQRFDGSVNVIYLNDVEIKEKDFKDWLNRVVGEDIFMICSNPSIFTSKNTKDRREILFNMIPSYTNEDIVKTDSRFLRVADILHIGSPEEIKVEDAISAVKHRINGKGRGDKGLKGQQDAIPVRIDESSKKICDVAEFELAIAGLKEQIADLDNRESELNDAIKSFDEKTSRIMDMKFEESDIIRKANEALVSEKNRINDEIASYQQQKKNAENDLRTCELGLKHITMSIERIKAAVKEAQEDWKKYSASEFSEEIMEMIKAEAFDEESLICPTCGQNLPEDQANQIRIQFEEKKLKRIHDEEIAKAKFYENKKKKLAAIVETGNSASENLKNAQKTKDETEQNISELKKSITYLAMKIQNLEMEKSKLPDSVDLSNNTEYQQIAEKISFAEKALNEMNTRSSEREEIKEQRTRLISEITSYELKIKASQEAQDRADELREELKIISQKIADAQEELDLLDDFNRTKINMITERINENFDFIKFRMFRKLVNGDYEPCCEMLVNGTSYDGNLNTGDKLLAELDLLSTFQRINDVSVPVFLDSAGEVDADRVPETDFQLIMLQRTDDRELTVEVIR